MNWFKSLLSGINRSTPKPSSNFGRPFDEIYEETGVFTYCSDGFTIAYEGVNESIKWTDITEISVFKKDLNTTDLVCMGIAYNGTGLIIDEELPGWYQFVLKTKEIFPAIPKEWDIDIVQPPMETNLRTIYKV